MPTMPTNKTVKLLPGATIGSICLMKEEIYISKEKEPRQAMFRNVYIKLSLLNVCELDENFKENY